MRSGLLRWTLAITFLTATVCAFSQPSQSGRIKANYGKLPLTFEANQGQSDPQVQFLSRGKGYTAFLTGGSMVLSLRPAAAPTAPSGNSTSTASTVQFNLLGASANPAVVGEYLQPGRVNYFFGNNPAKWRTNVPTYGRVRYKNLYPGIDLIYYGSNQQLEYDFALQPGADPRQIQFEIKGANQIALDEAGTLILKVGSGELHFQAPLIYQESNGRRLPVGGSYVVNDATHIGFRVPEYDSNKPLVIDPVLLYSTYLGGSGDDTPTGIAVDSTGSVYIAGYTDSADFPLATIGALPKNTNHVFVAKLNAAGSTLIYADYIGGNSQDYGVALVLDSSKNVYVTGSTGSNNFPVVNPYQGVQPGPYSGFLTKVSADGSSLLYSTYLGGNTFDQPTGIAIDSLGQVHVAGFTQSQNFPVANAYQATATANQGGVFGDYGFLTKFSADGSSLVYSTFLFGNSNVVQDCGSPCWPSPYNVINAVAVDANGNAYVTGTSNTNNFPTTSGVYLANNSTPPDSTVGFVSKFTSAGALGYSTYLYPSSGNPVNLAAIAVDGSGAAYVAGFVDSDGTFPVTSTSICDPGVIGFGCSYTFVTKFDSAAATLLYSTFLGPNNYASPQAMTVDASGDAYVLTSTFSNSFQTTNAIEPYANNSDLLLVEIDPGATTQLFSTYLGGSGNETPSGLARDSSGNLYVAGATSSTDLPIIQGAFQNVFAGDTDAFVAKIGPSSASAVSLSTASLLYTAQQVGTSSAVQQVLLRNMGSAALTFTSIAPSGDFSETDTCGSSVPAAENCTLSVTFTPTVAGARTGSITLRDNAAGSPHTISLSGTGIAPAVTLAPSSLTFSGVLVGSTSTPQTVTLTNTGNATLNISSLQIAGDFAQTNNCGSTLAASASCTFSVTFVPTVSGSRTGSLTVNDNAPGSPQSVALSGSGPDFTLTSSASTATIKAGATATYTLTVSPVNGAFPNAIKLSCAGAPSHAACSLSSSSVTPGANSTNVTVTITTAANSADMIPLFPSHNQPVYAVWMQLQGFGLFGMMLAGSKGWKRNWKNSLKSKKVLVVIALALLIAGLLFMTACAGGTGIAPHNQSGTPTGSYTITITGVSGSLQHSLPLTLTVQ